jgi:hexosaminidase
MGSNERTLRTSVTLALRRVASSLLVALPLTGCARAMAPAESVPTSAPAQMPAAPHHALLPIPASIELSATDHFQISGGMQIQVPPGDAQAEWIARWLAGLIGTAADTVAPRVVASSGAPPAGGVQLLVRPGVEGGEEGYQLQIRPQGVTITGGGHAGLFYGVQTLRQLLPPAVEHPAALPRPIRVPVGTIADRPRFAWRGAMLDVSRHFVPLDEVKRYVDLLALHKLNRLHLHLSDDQGWRIEIRSWPNLALHGGSTEVGGGPGGYYTQAQYADLVRYAQERFVTIVPEIDMPGHTNAALASYPELNCDGVAPPLYTGITVGFSTLCVEREVTYRFVDDVVREIAALTPGAYFHIGGDEVEKLTDEQYRRFIERVERIVHSHGKRAIGWGEIAAADLQPSSVIQHWRPDTAAARLTAAAAARGNPVILSPANRVYLDMKYDTTTVIGLNWAGYVDVRQSYDWEPAALLQGVPEGGILGVEGPLWSETLVHRHEFDHMAFPRLAAVAELGWSAAERRNWEGFRVWLAAQAPRWTALGIHFHRAPGVLWE